MIIIANLIVISFMGQSNFRSVENDYKPENQKRLKSFFKRLNQNDIPDSIDQFYYPNAKSSNFSFQTKQKLDSMVFQYFDEYTNVWAGYLKDEYTYDSNGNVITKTEYETEEGGNEWKPWSMYEYSYISDNWLSSELYYYFDQATNHWLKNWKYEYGYDEIGNLIIRTNREWDEGLNNWADHSKFVYAYNSGYEVDSIIAFLWDIELDQWKYSSKWEKTYDENGNLSNKLFFNWDVADSEWNRYSKNEYAYFENIKLQHKIGYLWYGEPEEWKYSNKQEYEYDANDNLVLKSYFHWYQEENNWIGSYREEYIYDANDNVIEFNQYDWNNMTGQWEYDYQSSFSYDNSYSFDDLVLPFEIEEESQEDNVNLFNHMITDVLGKLFDGGSWLDVEKVELHYSSMEVGIHENQMISAIVYPNPAADFVSFRLDEGPRKMQLEIIDMFGKVVLTQLISNGGKVSVGQLKSSIYFYRLMDGDRVFSSGKLSVQ